MKPIIRYGKVFVLIIDEEIIGVAEYIKNFENNEVFLYGFSIKKKFRKHGYGKILLENSIKIFQDKKIKKINLTVSPNNKEAIKLYKKLEFEGKEILKDEYGSGIDRLHLSKKI